MHINRRLRQTALLAAAVTALVAGLATAASAASAPQRAPGDRGVGLAPTARDAGVASANNGGQGADFTGDGFPDILAREKGTGKLKVYPHSGTFNGANTFPSVVVVNAGWQNMRWIGAADVSGDGHPDVLAIDQNWRLVVALHSGTFNGGSTLLPGLITLGYNWNINDLVFPYDYDADGRADVLAKNAQSDDTVVYLNKGGALGTSMLAAPQLVASGGAQDVFQGLADVTLDGVADLVFVLNTGLLGVVNLGDGSVRILGTGWNTLDEFVLTRLNGDGAPDIMGRQKSSGFLLGYPHSGGYDPANPYATYPAGYFLGSNWQLNDIIT